MTREVGTGNRCGELAVRRDELRVETSRLAALGVCDVGQDGMRSEKLVIACGKFVGPQRIRFSNEPFHRDARVDDEIAHSSPSRISSSVSEGWISGCRDRKYRDTATRSSGENGALFFRSSSTSCAKVRPFARARRSKADSSSSARLRVSACAIRFLREYPA